MFDFRYHALSLVAVFVALVIGLLLGVAIGDKELVSGAREDLERDLQGEVSEARAEARDLAAELRRRRRYAEQTYRPLVADRLDGRRIVLLFVDDRSDAVFQHVRDALEPSGGELTFVTTLRRPLDLEAIAALAAGTRYQALAQDPTLLDDLGRRIGVQLVRGGRLLRELRGELLASSSGELEPAEGIVVTRGKGGEGGDEARRRQDAFLDGLLDGLRGAGAPVVGVEETRTDPSQVPWYQDHEMASVDNVDDIAGRASLVVALSGAATGTYGQKATADALIPEALVRGP